LANIEGVEVRRTVEVDEKDDFLITTDERKTVVSKCRLVKADLDVIMFMIRG
jgi:S-adenosylhomocysteine hydrolase